MSNSRAILDWVGSRDWERGSGSAPGKTERENERKFTGLCAAGTARPFFFANSGFGAKISINDTGILRTEVPDVN